MNTEDLAFRLGHTALPEIELPMHRQQLKQALSGMDIQPRTFLNWLPVRQPVWKTALITSSAWMLVIAALAYAILAPVSGAGISTAMAADIALNSPQIKSLIPAGAAATVTATDIGNHKIAIYIQYHGILINAEVDANRNLHILTITHVTYLPTQQSTYLITPDYRAQVLTMAGADLRIKALFDGGASVRRIDSVNCNVATNNIDTGTITSADEMFALLVLTSANNQPAFLINLETGEIISMSDSN
jgi:hypothetical protein